MGMYFILAELNDIINLLKLKRKPNKKSNLI